MVVKMNSSFEILVTLLREPANKVAVDDLSSWGPAADVYGVDDKFIVQVDLSGVEPGVLSVQANGDYLLIKGTRPDQAHVGSRHYFNMEIDVGPFSKRIEIPVSVDPESAIAEYKNGFLFIIFNRK
jgi:HSP20 family molecular chaperone IbpA